MLLDRVSGQPFGVPPGGPPLPLPLCPPATGPRCPPTGAIHDAVVMSCTARDSRPGASPRRDRHSRTAPPSIATANPEVTAATT